MNANVMELNVGAGDCVDLRSLLMNILDAPNVGVSLFSRLESSCMLAVCVVFRLRMPMEIGILYHHSAQK